MIQRLLAADHVTVIRLTPELFERAFALYSAHRDKEWGLTDCVSFVVMREKGIADALTSDRHFVQAGFRALMRPDS
jgi:predicted nucleic acid-binding protein